MSYYSQQDDDFLKANYHRLTDRQLANMLGRSMASVSARRFKLGLTKTEEMIEQMDYDTRQFNKGNIPWNKGKTGYMGANRTSFKKGNIPPNAKPDGTITIRGDSSGMLYYHIKVPEHRKMIMLHVWLWTQEHGEVKKGHVVVFKDGDSLNCVLENLECISRGELLRRNNKQRRELMEVIKENDELYRVWLLNHRLKKKIKSLKKR